MTIVLADLGGTHLRLARLDDAQSIVKYKIANFPSLESVLQDFAPDISGLYLASAITPLNDIIEDKRFSGDSHWRIDLNALKQSLKTLKVLNDLEAAAYGLAAVALDQMTTLLPATVAQIHFDAPPKLLIGIGTGIGHAFLFEKKGAKPFVQRTHGGHIPAYGITQEQRDVIDLLQSHNKLPRDLIMENIIGGKGLWTLGDLIGKDKALKFFWEFLGLYCNNLVSTCGAYGGVYLTGGIMDDMAEEKSIDAESFGRYYRRPMVDVVVEGLAATPVYYCHEVNLPILGLSIFAKTNT